MVWYIEAASAELAVERVWPAKPDKSPMLINNGGIEEPFLEAHTFHESVPWAVRIRRLPGNVAVTLGDGARLP